MASDQSLVGSAGEALGGEGPVACQTVRVASEAGAGERVEVESGVTDAGLVGEEGGISSAGSALIVGVASVAGGWAVSAEAVCEEGET